MTETHQWTVVTVNDPLIAQGSVAQLLRDAGYRVIETATNEEACSLAEREGAMLLLREQGRTDFVSLPTTRRRSYGSTARKDADGRPNHISICLPAGFPIAIYRGRSDAFL